MGEGTEVCDMFFQSRHTFIRYCVVLPYPVLTNKSMIVRDRISVTNILNVSHNGFYMLIFQTPVNFCSDENVQTIFGTKLEDLLNYRIDYNSISQTVEKVVKKIFLACRKCPKLEIVRCWLSRQWRYSGGRSTYYYFGALKTIFFTTFSTVWDIKL
jgi:hypothetical protein